MASLNGTLIVSHVLHICVRLQEVGISGFVDDFLDIQLHLIKQIRRENKILVFKASLDRLPNVLGYRQFAFFKKPINGADDLLHLLAIALLLETLTREIKIQSIAVNAAFQLDILLEQFDAVAILK